MSGSFRKQPPRGNRKEIEQRKKLQGMKQLVMLGAPSMAKSPTSNLIMCNFEEKKAEEQIRTQTTLKCLESIG
jgi:hypothetical protein